MGHWFIAFPNFIYTNFHISLIRFPIFFKEIFLFKIIFCKTKFNFDKLFKNNYYYNLSYIVLKNAIFFIPKKYKFSVMFLTLFFDEIISVKKIFVETKL